MTDYFKGIQNVELIPFVEEEQLRKYMADSDISLNVMVDTIGSNVIVGAGSIVTKDIPDNVIAVGNPCKELRMLTHKDKEYWDTLLADYRAELEQI